MNQLASFVQCGAAPLPAPFGLPTTLQGGSYAPLIKGHIRPFMERGGKTVILHNPLGLERGPNGRDRYRFTAQKMGALPRTLARVFQAEWLPLVGEGLDLRVYIGPIATDPCADDELDALLRNIGETLKPFLGVASVIYHDALPFWADQSNRLLLLTEAMRAITERGGSRMGVEGPVHNDRWLNYPMLCSEPDWNAYRAGDEQPKDVVRWIRDIPESDLPAAVKAVQGDGHLPAVDLVGLGSEKCEILSL